mmetsp:Transcript_2658/g.4131  ORF Transcript_2658/g.4131 Transcript_2658/m.4131 type:complete len:111 (+) Transcript_2658:63-395(+)
MFSMFVDMAHSNSKIQIGGYDLGKYAKSDLNWYKISSPFFWQVDFGEVSLGDFKFTPSVSSIMADTGTSLNMIPDADYYSIYDTFFKGKLDCHVLPNTLTSCQCNDYQHE